uniref:Uncharacterized protein n=1 Tax=Romanomermis culicivorax TaxID=13658 RepID=A0A915IUP3_ROMCU
MDKKSEDRMVDQEDTGMLQSDLEKKINWFENHFAEAQNALQRNMEEERPTTSWNHGIEQPIAAGIPQNRQEYG